MAARGALMLLTLLGAIACGSRSGLLEVGQGGAAGQPGGAGATGDGGTLSSGGAGGAGGGNGGTGGIGGSGGSAPACAPSGGPTQIAAGVPGAHAIGVDATHVYFTIATDAGSLRRVPKQGGAVETLATGLGRPRHLALWADDIYVTSPMTGAVVRVKNDGSVVFTLFDGSPHPNGIAVDDKGAFWVRSSASTGELLTLPHGGLVSSLLVLDLASPYDLALAGANAYVIDNGSGKVTPSVRRIHLLTGEQQILTEFPVGNAHDIAVHGAWVYFTLNAEVRRVRTNGSEEEQLGQGVFLRGISAGEAGVYWAERGAGDSPGQIVRWRDGVIDVIAGAQSGPQGIVVDEACVYWTNDDAVGENGSVHAAPL